MSCFTERRECANPTSSLIVTGIFDCLMRLKFGNGPQGYHRAVATLGHPSGSIRLGVAALGLAAAAEAGTSVD
jgi:hypothetical protein